MDSYFVEIQRPFMPPSDDARLVLIADGSLHRALEDVKRHLFSCVKYAKKHGVYVLTGLFAHEGNLCLCLLDPGGEVVCRQPAIHPSISFQGEFLPGDRIEVAHAGELGNVCLCVDCDIGLRNLDIALGLSDAALMDFSDVAQQRCTLERAVVSHPQLAKLFLLTAPIRQRGQPVTGEQMASLLRAVRIQYDFCLLDAPAGLGDGFLLATAAADRCVVVTTADASSLRDAQHTVMELGRFGPGKLHLVVNRVRKKLLRSMHATIDDAMDKAGLPLLGVVPEDDALPLALNRGSPILLSAPASPASSAYRNIATRLRGGKAPLLRIK